MNAPSFPLRYRGSRSAAWMGSILFLVIGCGAMFSGAFVERDAGAVFVGAIVAALSGGWVLYLLVRRPPVLVLHAEALEWRGQRVPYSAVTVGPLRSATHDGSDAHSFEILFGSADGARSTHATIHSEQFPRWQEIREVLADRIAAAGK